MCDGFAARRLKEKKLWKEGTAIAADDTLTRSKEVAQANYETYKSNLRALVSQPGYENIEVMEYQENQGFSVLVQAAVFEIVKTPLVMVIQHDWHFQRPVDLDFILNECFNARNGLARDASLNYVTFSTSASKNHFLQIFEEYNKHLKALPQLQQLEKPPYSIALSQNLYLPSQVKKKKANDSHSNSDVVAEGKSGQEKDGVTDSVEEERRCSLFPLVYFFDRNHIARVEFYRDVVFQEKSSSNSFLETSFGEHVRRLSKQEGFETIFQRYRMAMFHPDLPQYLSPGALPLICNPTLVHLNGRTSVNDEQKRILQSRSLQESVAPI